MKTTQKVLRDFWLTLGLIAFIPLLPIILFFSIVDHVIKPVLRCLIVKPLQLLDEYLGRKEMEEKIRARGQTLEEEFFNRRLMQ